MATEKTGGRGCGKLAESMAKALDAALKRDEFRIFESKANPFVTYSMGFTMPTWPGWSPSADPSPFVVREKVDANSYRIGMDWARTDGAELVALTSADPAAERRERIAAMVAGTMPIKNSYCGMEKIDGRDELRYAPNIDYKYTPRHRRYGWRGPTPWDPETY